MGFMIPQLRYSIALFIVLLFSLCHTGFSEQKVIPGFAVLEVFSSEARVQSRYADKLVGEFVQYAASKKKPIYVLSYHVSYLDYLGWKDPFAQPSFSKRQIDYAQQLGKGQVYVPQMVINGGRMLLATKKKTILKHIGHYFGKQTLSSLTLKAEWRGTDIVLYYNVKELLPDARLQVAVVKRKIINRVGSGENKGQMLKHWNVVRQLLTLRARSKGQVKLKGLRQMGDFEIIVFLQNPHTLEIQGASQLSLGDVGIPQSETPGSEVPEADLEQDNTKPTDVSMSSLG